MYKSINIYPTIHIDNPHMSDIIVAQALQERLIDKELKKKVVYQSPKRDNLCSQCGQQLHWCVCHLNDYKKYN